VGEVGEVTESATVGVIGGSGFYELLENAREVDIDTPFGPPSDRYFLGEIGGVSVAFLPRHGRGHRISPGEVNYRANLWGMKALGVRYVLSASAVGSLREELRPLDVVVPDQLFDRTKTRPSTFFGDGIVVHVGFADPFCAYVSKLLVAAGREVGATIHEGGTYVCIEGPQFSTLAESLTYKGLGYSVIGMTNLPEAKLAREAELCYATVAMVTDFDCWHPDHDAVTVTDIIKVLMANAEKAARLVARLARDFPREHEPCPIGSDRALDTAIITAPEARDPELLKKLDAVAGRVLGRA
jgi:5'-methylthioadenosine phosphorylase